MKSVSGIFFTLSWLLLTSMMQLTRIDAFKSWYWAGWWWIWSSNTLVTWCEELTHWENTNTGKYQARKEEGNRGWDGLMASLTLWENPNTGKYQARKEEGNRGWDGLMASLTPWTWVWANSGRYWRTAKPGVLQFMALQTIGQNLVTEQTTIYKQYINKQQYKQIIYTCTNILTVFIPYSRTWLTV